MIINNIIEQISVFNLCIGLMIMNIIVIFIVYLIGHIKGINKDKNDNIFALCIISLFILCLIILFLMFVDYVCF